MATIFKILGSGAGPGVPSFFCDCPGCREAEWFPEAARTRSGAFIDTEKTKILVDASPDLRTQLIRENIRQLDCVFLTHWHYDHFGGLGELEYYVKLERRKKLALLLPPDALEQFAAAYPGLADIFAVTPWEYNRQYYFGELCLTPLPANHGVQTAGILLESKSGRLGYFPDTAGLPDATAKKINDIDWLFCDATFYGENWYPKAHMSIEEAIDLGSTVRAKNTVLTHLAIHYSQPVTTKQLKEEIAKYPGVLVAYDSMSINL